MSEENGNVLDLGSFDFTPAWAKKDAGVSIGKVRPARDDSRGPKEGGRGFGERKGFGGKKSFGERKSFGDRKPFGERRPFERRERPQPLAVEVKVLPETKALGTIIRKLQGDFHAYKLKDLAYFFLDNPSSILLKVSPKPAQPDQSAQPAQPLFHQCKVCGFVSTDADEVVQHVVNAHLDEYFEAKEVETEPPKGNFNCVAKCGLSGVLLGPPNIHEFNAVVKEMIRTRYPEMSESQYRAHIEMVRDADTIEEWRKGATRKTVFVAKGDETGAELSRTEAESRFRQTALPLLVETPKNLMITAEVALKSPLKPLVWAVRDALEQERRAPYAMCFALRGAFHHRKLNFFRANDARGPEFVVNAELKAFDAEHAIPELQAVAAFLAEHPCCDKSEFPAAIADFEKQLTWLVTTGHAVAFTNGVYSLAEKFPKYGPQWKKRSRDIRPEVAKMQDGEPAQVEAPKPVETVESVENVESVEKVESVEVKGEGTPIVAE